MSRPGAQPNRPEIAVPLHAPRRKPRGAPPSDPPADPPVTIADWYERPATVLASARERRFVREALKAGASGQTLRDAATAAGCVSLARLLGSDRVVAVLELLAPLELEPAAAVALLEPLRVARLFETARHGTTGAQRIAAERELADRYGRPSRAIPGTAAQRGQRAPAPGGFAAARELDRARRASKAAGASPAGAIGETPGPSGIPGGAPGSPADPFVDPADERPREVAAGAPGASPEVAG